MFIRTNYVQHFSTMDKYVEKILKGKRKRHKKKDQKELER
jgi:hypothetical protein